jgi:hypothetical protein
MPIIKPFQPIIDLADDEHIEKEIAAFPEEKQADMYFLMKEILRDELQFVIRLEKYRTEFPERE